MAEGNEEEKFEPVSEVQMKEFLKLQDLLEEQRKGEFKMRKLALEIRRFTAKFTKTKTVKNLKKSIRGPYRKKGDERTNPHQLDPMERMKVAEDLVRKMNFFHDKEVARYKKQIEAGKLPEPILCKFSAPGLRRFNVKNLSTAIKEAVNRKLLVKDECKRLNKVDYLYSLPTTNETKGETK